MMVAQKRVLAMFAKYWQPRQVKTRLGDEIGHGAASQLYWRFIQTLLARLSGVGHERILVFTPESRRQAFERVCEALPWQLSVQSSGDLGQRMSTFFGRRLARRTEHIVLIGSDSPTLPIRRIDQAFDALEHRDIVLGPCCDGGYYLIGLKDHLPALFSGVDWSTERVLQQTLDRIADVYPNVNVHLLEEWYDVDSLADVGRMHAELLEEKTLSPALVALRDHCGSVVRAD